MTTSRTNKRTYEETHPWLTFSFDLNKLKDHNWMRIGEALSKCDHLSGVPLAPGVAADLHQVFLAKGIQATTQIEGNTLSEEQVRLIVDGQELHLPESQSYLETEATNILDACNMVMAELWHDEDMAVTKERILRFHELVMKDLPQDQEVTPGKTRNHAVVVGAYRGAPAEDIEYLLDRLCRWLVDLCGREVPYRFRRPMSLIRAILAHLYIAWIHPFGDGNGRTARLIEFQLLVSAGLPTPACHLLSNYYNKTKARYVEVLRETSRDPEHPVEKFVSYALDGFVEELRDAIKIVRGYQMRVAWVNFVHETFEARSDSDRRRRDLVLALPDTEFVALADIRHLSSDLAERYANMHARTITRDAHAISDMGLVELTDDGVRARTEQIEAFLPLRADAAAA